MGAGRPGPPARPGGGGGPRPGAVGAWRGGPAGGPLLTGGGCRRGSFGRGDGGASDILELWKNTKIVKWQNLELHFVFWRKKIARNFFSLLIKKQPFIIFFPKKQRIYDYLYEFASEAPHIVIFENFVKTMTSC